MPAAVPSRANLSVRLLNTQAVVPVWSKNPIRTKSKGDGSRGPGGPDGSVTPRYITKESRRNVGMAYLETSLRYLVFSARSSFLTIRDHAPRIGIQDDRQIN